MLAKEKRLLRAERQANSFSAQIRQISNPINDNEDVHPPSIRISGSCPQEHGKIITAKILITPVHVYSNITSGPM
jgi:hypothetical protein